jgi:hypothetical protein
MTIRNWWRLGLAIPLLGLPLMLGCEPETETAVAPGVTVEEEPGEIEVERQGAPDTEIETEP